MKSGVYKIKRRSLDESFVHQTEERDESEIKKEAFHMVPTTDELIHYLVDIKHTMSLCIPNPDQTLTGPYKCKESETFFYNARPNSFVGWCRSYPSSISVVFSTLFYNGVLPPKDIRVNFNKTFSSFSSEVADGKSINPKWDELDDGEKMKITRLLEKIHGKMFWMENVANESFVHQTEEKTEEGVKNEYSFVQLFKEMFARKCEEIGFFCKYLSNDELGDEDYGVLKKCKSVDPKKWNRTSCWMFDFIGYSASFKGRPIVLAVRPEWNVRDRIEIPIDELPFGYLLNLIFRFKLDKWVGLNSLTESFVHQTIEQSESDLKVDLLSKVSEFKEKFSRKIKEEDDFFIHLKNDEYMNDDDRAILEKCPSVRRVLRNKKGLDGGWDFDWIGQIIVSGKRTIVLSIRDFSKIFIYNKKEVSVPIDELPLDYLIHFIERFELDKWVGMDSLTESFVHQTEEKTEHEMKEFSFLKIFEPWFKDRLKRKNGPRSVAELTPITTLLTLEECRLLRKTEWAKRYHLRFSPKCFWGWLGYPYGPFKKIALGVVRRTEIEWIPIDELPESFAVDVIRNKMGYGKEMLDGGFALDESFVHQTEEKTEKQTIGTNPVDAILDGLEDKLEEYITEYTDGAIWLDEPARIYLTKDDYNVWNNIESVREKIEEFGYILNVNWYFNAIGKDYDTCSMEIAIMNADDEFSEECISIPITDLPKEYLLKVLMRFGIDKKLGL